MKIRSISDRGLVRLIPATYHKPPVLRGIVDTQEEADVLALLEGKTSARLLAEKEGLPQLDRRELAYRRRAQDLKVYGEKHINAAFVYTRAGGNRFNEEGRGAWYCSYDFLTSAQEVGYHRNRELGFIGKFVDEARYVELLADFVGEFPELCANDAHPALAPEPDKGYPEGQRLAKALRMEGHRGLLYPSVRHEGGRCFVAFDPGIVQNVRPGASWCFRWDGRPMFDLLACSA